MQNQNSMTEGLNQSLEKFKRMWNGSEDIVSVIEEDHKPLKELIAVMKDGDKSFGERQKAFADFAPLLMTHAKAEEKSLYDYMKTQSELKQFAFEGEAEHEMADQLCEEIKRATLEAEVSAKIKALAEAVEHHIREEENDVLPAVESKVDSAKRIALTKIYVDWQEKIIADGQDDSPHEADLTSGSPNS